ncbi:hypothetical protein Tco_0346462, partial [Tanacetum coccineum]
MRHQPHGLKVVLGGWSISSPKATLGSYLNPLIANFEKRNKQGTIEYHLQQVKNANLKWRELP